jgi:hypothetical protein
MHHVSCPHTKQQNGSAKRKHRHILEVGLSLLAHASMSLKFWDEAFSTATYLINRLPSRVINFVSPFEKLFGTQPDYTWLKVFGCACWPHLRPYNTRKLEFKSKKCVFLGYSSSHKGYICLDPSTGRVYISRDVVFDEIIFPFSQLHPNAGSHLHVEILLLPPTLCNFHEDALVDDHRANGTNPGTAKLDGVQVEEITRQTTGQETSSSTSPQQMHNEDDVAMDLIATEDQSESMWSSVPAQ